jgi:hypothetical protein
MKGPFMTFDPYHKWLGIPSEEQPANHYRLLGVQVFESDLEVVASAADRQMSHVKTQAVGKYADHSQKLLNELAAARVCLLNPDRKAKYDAQLRNRYDDQLEFVALKAAFVLQEHGTAAEGVMSPPWDVASDFDGARAISKSTRKRRRENPSFRFLFILVIGMIGLLVWYRLTPSSRNSVVLTPDTETGPIESNRPQRSKPTDVTNRGEVNHARRENARSAHDKETIGNAVPIAEGANSPNPKPNTSDPDQRRQPNFSQAARWVGVGVHTQGNAAGKEFQTHEMEIVAADSSSVSATGRWTAYRQNGIGRGDYSLEATIRDGVVESRANSTNPAKGRGTFRDGGFLWKWDSPPHVGENWYVPTSAARDAIEFADRYRIITNSDQTYELNLFPNRTAQQSNKPEVRGGWVGTSDRVLIVWSDGWRDMLVGDGDSLKRQAFGPSISLTASPSETGEAVRIVAPHCTVTATPVETFSEKTAPSGASAVMPLGSPAIRLPIPDESALTGARAKVAELVRGTSKGAEPSKLVELTRNLLTLADQSKEDPAAEYALLNEARNQAAEAGDFNLAMEITDRLAAKYRSDAFAEKAAALEIALDRRRKRPDARIACARLGLVGFDACDKAIAEDAFSQARKIAEIVQAAAEASTSRPLITKATNLTEEISKLEAANAAQIAARQILAKEPDNPDANLAVGKYLCVMRNRWSSGLPYLTKCASQQIRNAAVLDLSTPSLVEKQLECGDQWWELALKTDGMQQKELQRRAVHWYQIAQNRLKGLDRARIDKRISEVLLPEVFEPIDLMETARLSKAVPHGRLLGDGRLVKISGDLAEVHLPTNLPQEFELLMELRRPNRTDGHLSVHLLLGNFTVFVVIDGIQAKGRHCRIYIGSEIRHVEAEVCRDDKWHEIRIAVKRNSVSAYADGNGLLTFATTTDLKPTLSRDGDFVNRVDLLATKATYEVRRLRLVPIADNEKVDN